MTEHIESLSASRPMHGRWKMLSLFRSMQRYETSWLLALGLMDDSQIKLKAFSHLEEKLLQLSWVAGVTTRRFVQPQFDGNLLTALPVYVIASEMLSSAMHREMENIVTDVNLRFGTHFQGIAIEPKQLISSLFSSRSS